METINWGIIGCGDVCEVKSGPAFQKASQSKLVAVMRRDVGKAQDFAIRHGVPQWYSNAHDLLANEEINAVYIATPPSTHLQYASMALQAGKHVYLEKPITCSYGEALELKELCSLYNRKLVVAHYRREQPYFKKIESILQSSILGSIRCITLRYYKPSLTLDELFIDKIKWRVDPAISGGGLFHDMAPHQLDILLHHFGYPIQVYGIAYNQSGMYNAPDVVSAAATFKNDIAFQGMWCFNAAAHIDEDVCEMIGANGLLKFNFFSQQPIVLKTNEGQEQLFSFTYPQHVQQDMIQQAVLYFLGKRDNPCPVQAGVDVMKLMEGVLGSQ